MEREIESLDPPIEGELSCEALGGDPPLVRVNLRPFVVGGFDSDELLEAFIASANLAGGGTRRMEVVLSLAVSYVQCAGRGELAPELKAQGSELAEKGYPAIHHSEAYVEAYRPAYRVVDKTLATNRGGVGTVRAFLIMAFQCAGETPAPQSKAGICPCGAAVPAAHSQPIRRRLCNNRGRYIVAAGDDTAHAVSDFLCDRARGLAGLPPLRGLAPVVVARVRQPNGPSNAAARSCGPYVSYPLGRYLYHHGLQRLGTAWNTAAGSGWAPWFCFFPPSGSSIW